MNKRKQIILVDQFYNNEKSIILNYQVLLTKIYPETENVICQIWKYVLFVLLL